MLYLGILFALELLVVVQAALSWQLGLFTGTQMRAQGLTGLPFVWHGAMWLDMILINPVLAGILTRYRWGAKEFLIAGAAGLVISILLHYSYCVSGLDSAHVIHRRLNIVGWIHLVYVTIVIAGLIAFYLLTPIHVSGDMAKVTAVLIAFLVIGEVQPALYLGQQIFNLGTLVELIGIVLGCLALAWWRR